MQAVQNPIIPIIGKAIKNTPGTISLAQGVVNYDPPPSVYKSVEKTMRDRSKQLYGAVEGHPELLELISEKLSVENNIKLADGYGLMVTAGASMAFLNVLLAICDPGDEVVLLAPYYFNHEMAVNIVNCKAVIVNTDEEYQANLTAITQAITSKTKAIVTVSPNNPTGVVYSKESLVAINQLCKQHGLYHISDEAYEYFVYDDEAHFSAASLENSSEYTISLFSLSKSYGLAGWRIGYMVFPQHLFKALQKIQDTNVICATQVSQQAAIACFKTGSNYCKQHLDLLNQLRQQCILSLKSLDSICELVIPKGAFYIFLKLHTDLADMDIALHLIKEHNVALLPGSTFGATDTTYLRLSYGALSKNDLSVAMERLTVGLGHSIS